MACTVRQGVKTWSWDAHGRDLLLLPDGDVFDYDRRAQIGQLKSARTSRVVMVQGQALRRVT